MDAVSAILDGHRARGAFLLRCVMAAPWSIQIADRAQVGVLVMVRGHACVVRGAETVTLGPGDVAVLSGPDPYVLADDPERRPTVSVEPGQECRTLDPDAQPIGFGIGLRSWGNDPDGECAFLTGTYELPSQITGRLLAGLPGLVVARAADGAVPAAALLAAEFERDAPGQTVVLDRLVDLVLIGTLRVGFESGAVPAPPWWLAQQDQVVGAALRLMHEQPAEAWTLGQLATAAVVSRATLARRFTDLVGQPPMAYLTEWRLALAADLLRADAASITAIARQVGYANPFAFSTAFKRRFGVPPRDFRRSA